MKRTFATVAILLPLVGASKADDSRRILIESPGKEQETSVSSQEGALKFLADLPELKDVGLRISEQSFLKVLVLQKLPYKRSAENDRTTCYVTVPRQDGSANVFVYFRNGVCSGIQRMLRSSR